MRVLLRHKRTGLYCRSADRWVADPMDALDFAQSADAVIFSVRHQLKPVEIVFSFDTPQYDLRVPIAAYAE